MFRKPYSECTRQGKYKRRKKHIEGLSSQLSLSYNNDLTEAPNTASTFQETEDCGHTYTNKNSTSSSEENLFTQIDNFCNSSPGPSSSLCENTDLFDQDHSPHSSENDNDDENDHKEYGLTSLNEFESMKENLVEWAITYKINHVALYALFFILRNHICLSKLPKDPRTFLQTKKQIMTTHIGPGIYSHIGLVAALQKIWKYSREKVRKIELLIGIDGLPLSGQELWPILGMVFNVPSIKALIFPIGVYCGKSKPSSSDSFLKEFVDELKELMAQGFRWNNEVIPVHLKGFVLDAPAKAFVLNVKGHTGYNSCTKCTQRGSRILNRTTFPIIDAPKRTHTSFLRKTDKEFHNDSNPILLESIPGINFLNAFPLDYMHLVCLGVVRTIIFLWIFSKPIPQKICKLPAHILNSISNNLCSLKDHMPLEFNRRPRSLDEIKYWKATEFRQFLLYTGPVVLQSVLVGMYKPLYDHFLSLSISMYILLSPKFSTPANCEYAAHLLNHFVESTKTLYGDQYITHNFHGLTHLKDCIEDFGPIESASAFPFENFLQFFKRIVRKGDKPLQQIIKRCSEIMNSDKWFNSTKPYTVQSFPNLTHPHFAGPVFPTSDVNRQFSQINFPSFDIRIKHPNNCCVLSSGRVVIVENIVFSHSLNTPVIICRRFLETLNFYDDPFIPSSELGIFVLSNPSPLEEVPVEYICGKMVLLPYKNKYLGIPLLHTI